MARKKNDGDITPVLTGAATPAAAEQWALTVNVGAQGNPAAEFYAAALSITLGQTTMDQAAAALMAQYAGLPHPQQMDWVGAMDEAVARLQSVVRELPRKVIVR